MSVPGQAPRPLSPEPEALNNLPAWMRTSEGTDKSRKERAAKRLARYVERRCCCCSKYWNAVPATTALLPDVLPLSYYS